MKKILIVLSAVLALASCKIGSRGNEVPQYEKQMIDLPGVPNARQLGGYAIGDRKVRMDVLLRSGALSKASDEALATLRDTYKLALVADFRTSMERGAAPDKDVEGAQNVWLPVLEDLVCKNGSSAMASIQKAKDNPSEIVRLLKEPDIQEVLGGMYDAVVFDENHQRSYAAFLDSLVSLPEGRAVLWHCSLGKDRCGWGTAFVLAALGADRTLIVKDFEMSNISYSDEIEELVSVALKEGAEKELIDYIYLFKGVSATFFEKTLDSIDARYGSLDNFLEQALQLTSEERQLLKNRFLQ